MTEQMPGGGSFARARPGEQRQPPAGPAGLAVVGWAAEVGKVGQQVVVRALQDGL